jgi:hypothetical protein
VAEKWAWLDSADRKILRSAMTETALFSVLVTRRYVISNVLNLIILLIWLQNCISECRQYVGTASTIGYCEVSAFYNSRGWCLLLTRLPRPKVLLGARQGASLLRCNIRYRHQLRSVLLLLSCLVNATSLYNVIIGEFG